MAAKRRRRFWSDAEKRRIVAQTRVADVSVSAVARRYDVNANLVFKWLRDPRFGVSGDELPAFLPVEVMAPVGEANGTNDVDHCAVAPDGRIEIALPNGARLTLCGAFDPGLVVRLVRGLM